MGAKIQAIDIFQTPLSSHYPLPLKGHIWFKKKNVGLSWKLFSFLVVLKVLSSEMDPAEIRLIR